MHFIVVLYATPKVSSIRSAGVPYASIRMVAVYFYNEDKPTLPNASYLRQKYGDQAPRASTMHKNKCFLMRNLLRN
uniref:Uncharacterized protein n=1 Tax=Arundo donax TaxID=35708 RepID=A0A0A9TPY2_ARUDO